MEKDVARLGSLLAADDAGTFELHHDAPGTVEAHLSLIHISEPTRRTPISYAVFCLKKKKPP